MRLLVVEGNKKKTWKEREICGSVPYHKRFKAMLRILCPEAKVTFAFPADDDNLLPSVDKLRSFHGILWTGSSLHVNNPSPAVQRQLTFAEDVFKSGVPFYGSCWGLQIAVVVAGGQVATCRNGREIGISEPIEMTDSGTGHVYFQGRKKNYRVLCLHLDEVVKLPANSNVLAKNDHSEVQALTIQYKDTEFFGVQYHPEFLVSDMVFMIRLLSQSLIEDGIFDSEKAVLDYITKLEDHNDLPAEISDYLLHTQEIKNWLDHAVDPMVRNDYLNKQNNLSNGQAQAKHMENATKT